MLRRLIRLLFGEYECYWILELRHGLPVADRPSHGGSCVAVSANELAQCLHSDLQAQAWYLGSDAHGFGWRADGDLQAVCVYWQGERYRSRNFWPLEHGEAKLVQVITAPAARGRGYAGRLIAAASQTMFEHGFNRLLARVWVTNTSSLKAFKAAGWRRVALVVTARPGWAKGRQLRWNLGRSPARQT